MATLGISVSYPQGNSFLTLDKIEFPAATAASSSPNRGAQQVSYADFQSSSLSGTSKKLYKLKADYDHTIERLNANTEELSAIFGSRPQYVEQMLDYEKQLQACLAERYEIVIHLRARAEELVAKTDDEHIDKYVNKKRIFSPDEDQLEFWHVCGNKTVKLIPNMTMTIDHYRIHSEWNVDYLNAYFSSVDAQNDLYALRNELSKPALTIEQTKEIAQNAAILKDRALSKIREATRKSNIASLKIDVDFEVEQANVRAEFDALLFLSGSKKYFDLRRTFFQHYTAIFNPEIDDGQKAAHIQELDALKPTLDEQLELIKTLPGTDNLDFTLFKQDVELQYKGAKLQVARSRTVALQDEYIQLCVIVSNPDTPEHDRSSAQEQKANVQKQIQEQHAAIASLALADADQEPFLDAMKQISENSLYNESFSSFHQLNKKFNSLYKIIFDPNTSEEERRSAQQEAAAVKSQIGDKLSEIAKLPGFNPRVLDILSQYTHIYYGDTDLANKHVQLVGDYQQLGDLCFKINQANATDQDRLEYLHQLLLVKARLANRINELCPNKNDPEDGYVALQQRIELSCRRAAYDVELHRYISAKKEYDTEQSVLYSSSASEAEKEAALKRLVALKAALDQHLQTMQDLPSAEEFGVQALRTSLNTSFEIAQFYAQPNDQIVAELKHLQLINPDQYAEKSVIYLNKLLNLNDPRGAQKFAKNWMKSIPKNATQSQVFSIVWCYIQSSAKAEDPVDDDCRLNFENWAAEYQSGRASDVDFEATYQWARGHLFVTEGNLTFPARDCFHSCLATHPDESIWKSMLAKYYVTTLEYSKAKELIDGLDPEEASKVQLFLASDQFNHYSFVIDLLGIGVDHALSRCRKKSPLFLFFSTLKAISCEENAKTWFLSRYVVDYSRVFQPHCPRPNANIIALSIARLAHHLFLEAYFDSRSFNNERRSFYRSSYEKPVALALDIATVVYKIGVERDFSSLSILSETCSLSSGFLEIVDLTKADISPGWHALARIPQTVSGRVFKVGLFRKGLAFATPLIKRCAVKFCRENLYLSAAKLSAKIVTPQLTLVASSAYCAYGAHQEFYKYKSSRVLGKAMELMNKNQYSEAEKHLIDAQQWWFVDPSSFQHLANCIPFIQLCHQGNHSNDDIANIQTEMPKIDGALQHLKKTSHYTEAYLYLLMPQFSFYLNVLDIEKIKKVLSDETSNVFIFNQLFCAIIQKAEALIGQSFKDAETFLESCKPAFIQDAYLTVITKYQSYIDCRREQGAFDRNSNPAQVRNRLHMIDDLKNLFLGLDLGLNALEMLNYHQLLIELSREKFDSVNSQLALLSSTYHDDLLFRLFDCSNDVLQAVSLQLTEFKHIDFLKKWAEYRNNEQNQPLSLLSNPDEFESRLIKLEELKKLIETTDSLQGIQKLLSQKELSIYLATEKYEKITSLLSKINAPRNLHVQVASPIIANSKRHQNQEERASHLKEAQEKLGDTECAQIIGKFRAIDDCEEPDVKLHAINDFLNEIGENNFDPLIYNQIISVKCSLVLSKFDVGEIKKIISDPRIFPHKQDEFIHALCVRLICFAELDQETNYSSALVNELGLGQRELIVLYTQMIRLLERGDAISSLESYQKAVKKIDKLIIIFSEDSIGILQRLKDKKLHCHWKMAEIQNRARNYESALKNYELVLRLANPNDLVFLDFIKERVASMTQALNGNQTFPNET